MLNADAQEVFNSSIIFDKTLREISSPLHDYLSLSDRCRICEYLKYARDKLKGEEADDTS